MTEQLELFTQPLPVVVEILTFNQAVLLFMRLHWNGTKMATRSAALLGHLLNAFDGRLLHTIGRQDIIALRRYMESKGHGLAYVNKAHMVTKLLFNKFKVWRSDGYAGGHDLRNLMLPPENPATLVRKPSDPARDRFILPGEFRRLIQIAKRINDWDMVDILKVALWLRMSPIDLENWNDDEINEDNWQVELRRRHTITPRSPEGSLQVVPLREKIWGLIERRRQHRNPGEKRLLNFKNFKRRFNRLRKAAMAEGIKPFQLRDFRRSGSGFLWNKGFDLRSIADGMGQVSTTVTERHYKPKTRPHLKSQITQLTEAFDG